MFGECGENSKRTGFVPVPEKVSICFQIRTSPEPRTERAQYLRVPGDALLVMTACILPSLKP